MTLLVWCISRVLHPAEDVKILVMCNSKITNLCAYCCKCCKVTGCVLLQGTEHRAREMYADLWPTWQCARRVCSDAAAWTELHSKPQNKQCVADLLLCNRKWNGHCGITDKRHSSFTDLFFLLLIFHSFSAPTWSVWQQEGHPAWKKVHVGLLVVTI